MAPFREWHFTDHCKCSWHSPSCHFAMRQNSFPIQFKLISLYFKLTRSEFNKENIQNLLMGQNLISTLMDTTLRLDGVANNIQHSNFFHWIMDQSMLPSKNSISWETCANLVFFLHFFQIEAFNSLILNFSPWTLTWILSFRCPLL